MRTDPLSYLATELDSLKQQGLYRRLRILEDEQKPKTTIDHRQVVNLSSNNYLGLTTHQKLREAALDATRRLGVGSGSVRTIAGTMEIHMELERRLAAFKNTEAVVVFQSGFAANAGTVAAVLTKDDVVVSDELNHASIIDGSRLSRATIKVFPHKDVDAARQILSELPAGQRKLLITDGVFSMDGDIAPLPAMLGLSERHDAWLLVDDAHGFGVIGPGGRGAPAHFGLRSPRLVYVGTLGKAAGVAGAFVAGAEEIVETVLQRARTYIYTTAAPAMLAAAIETSLQLIGEDEWRRERLRKLIAVLRHGMREGERGLAPSDTPIQPLVLGGNSEAVRASAALRERGILVPAIRPPTVPEGTARLRISLSAAHSEQEVLRLAAALHEVRRSGVATQA